MAWWKSRRLQFAGGSFALFLLLFICMRAIFYFGFSEVGRSVHPDTDTLLKTLYIGFKFDLRLAILVCLPLLVVSFLPRWNVLTLSLLRYLVQVYLAVVVVAVMAFYILDFGHYQYLGVRINSTVLRYAGDAAISARMVWESYPVVWILLGWVATAVAFLAATVALERRTLLRPGEHISRGQAALGAVIVGVFILGGILGRFVNFNVHNPVPLRWSDAFFSGNPGVSALGINPVLFFFDTFEQREPSYDVELVRQYYPVMARYLGVEPPDPARLDIDRRIPPQPHRLQTERPPNVVFIMLESLGASRVGVYGNPLKPTPVLDGMAADGWLFKNFYVPVSPTAKTVFGSITGLPDVSSVDTATRNPLIVEQRVVLNAFTDHRKFYFIGGAAGWANMRALISQSIKGVSLYEEGSWSEPIVDVWGISDLGLFREVDRILRKLPGDKPFFAYIQTAGNHRPFTIPQDNDGFEVVNPPAEELEKWSFRSAEQFNAVRLLDHSVGRFLDFAKAGGYFDNTIFVLFGDHNDRITRTPHMAPFLEALDLDNLHVPHIIYAPRLLRPRVIEAAVSLLDVVPTVAGLLGLEYVNSTMGRDINIAAPEGERVVFTQRADKRFPVIGAVSKDFMLRMNADGSDAKLHDLNSERPLEDVSGQHPEKVAGLKDIARGIYETTKFQFYYNTVEEARKRGAP